MSVFVGCKSHTPGIRGLGYVESGIEARRRLRAGWKQRKCKRCGKIYVWVSPRQVHLYGPWWFRKDLK